jgi:hypothetical protein
MRLACAETKNTRIRGQVLNEMIHMTVVEILTIQIRSSMIKSDAIAVAVSPIIIRGCVNDDTAVSFILNGTLLSPEAGACEGEKVGVSTRNFAQLRKAYIWSALVQRRR